MCSEGREVTRMLELLEDIENALKAGALRSALALSLTIS